LLWNRLNVRSYGGTFEGWTRLHSDGLSIELTSPTTSGDESLPATSAPAKRHKRRSRSAREQAAVAMAPGYLIVSRVAPAGSAVPTDVSVDALLLPGGMAIDEPVARIPSLWAPNGAPLAPEALAIELQPVSHVPGYDLIEAAASMDYALRDTAGAVCRGT